MARPKGSPNWGLLTDMSIEQKITLLRLAKDIAECTEQPGYSDCNITDALYLLQRLCKGEPNMPDSAKCAVVLAIWDNRAVPGVNPRMDYAIKYKCRESAISDLFAKLFKA